MPFETLIALASAVSGVLLAVGGIVAGRGWGAKSAAAQNDQLQDDINTLRKDLERARQNKKGQSDGASGAVSEQDHREMTELVVSLRTKLEQTETTSMKASAEAQRLRAQLDDTTQQLEHSKAKVQELEQANAAQVSTGQEAAAYKDLQKELQEAKRAVAKLEVVEKERDIALRRIRELDRAQPEDARLRSLQDQLRASENARTKLEQELRAAASKQSGIDPDELQKLRAELAAANDRLSVTELVMDGVRARSNMLTQELKKARQQLEEYKKA